MIIVELTYKVDLATIDSYLTAHRDFLEKYYQQGYFLVSGPKEPRTGGIIIALTTDLAQLVAILAQDPFYLHDLADYKFTPFSPVKSHKAIKELL
jgi:uncharacterized protein YciI